MPFFLEVAQISRNYFRQDFQYKIELPENVQSRYRKLPEVFSWAAAVDSPKPLPGIVSADNLQKSLPEILQSLPRIV